MQTTVIISVPDAVGASGWVASSLVTVTSAGLLYSTSANDKVTLCGSNDNTVPISQVSSLASFIGTMSKQDMGRIVASLGAFLFFAVLRTGTPATTGLSFELIGDDGTSGGGGAPTTVIQQPAQSVTSGDDLVEGLVTLTGAGTHYSTTAVLDSTAPEGTYYVLFVACPGGVLPVPGVVTMLHAPQELTQPSGPNVAVFDDSPPGVTIGSNGAGVVLSSSSTSFVSGGEYLRVDAAVLS